MAKHGERVIEFDIYNNLDDEIVPDSEDSDDNTVVDTLFALAVPFDRLTPTSTAATPTPSTSTASTPTPSTSTPIAKRKNYIQSNYRRSSKRAAFDQNVDESDDGMQSEESNIEFSSNDDDTTEWPLPVNESELVSDDDDNDAYVLENAFAGDVDEPVLSIPLYNYLADNIEIEDDLTGWEQSVQDSGPSCGPFLGEQSCNIPLSGDDSPETFFDALFDTSMWETIADETNQYARENIKSARNGRDAAEDMLHHSHVRHARKNSWKDVNSADIQMFFAHLIIMGLVTKSRLEEYWSSKAYTRTPFFGKYMSRNTFQNILWNIHVTDNFQHQAPHPEHYKKDSMYKIRPFIAMLERNFRHVYTPGRDLAADESCCPFKGRLRFKQYNPNKPNRFHIKLTMVSESLSGYIVGFEVFTGKGESDMVKLADTCDKLCTTTTKMVIGLLQKCNLLSCGRRIYMDNYYSSPELFYELYFKETYACGTVRSNRKGLPKAVTIPNKSKLSPDDCVFRRQGPLLAIRWMDKRPVTMLSTIHEAVEVPVKKRTWHGNIRTKPLLVVDYTNLMSGVDLSDQYLASYSFLKKSFKWWRKLLVHLFNMLLLNAYILNKKYGSKKMTHAQFREYIAEYLLCEALPNISRHPPKQRVQKDLRTRLVARHFPSKIPATVTCKRKTPSRTCVACNFTPKNTTDAGYGRMKIVRKSTCYWCKECEQPLCLETCFEMYHTEKNYRRILLDLRISELVREAINT